MKSKSQNILQVAGLFGLIALVLGGYYLVKQQSANQPITQEAEENPFEELLEKNPLLWQGTEKVSPDELNLEHVRQQLSAGTSNRPTLVNFFASWCDGCKSEKAMIQDLGKRYWPSKINVVGIMTHDVMGKNPKDFDFSGFSFPVLADAEDKMAKQYGVLGVPHTLLLDHEGVIRFVCQGPLDAEKLLELERTIALLLGEAIKEPKQEQNTALNVLSDFRFFNQDGQEYGSEELKNFVWVADFIFTSCKSMCPILTKKMQDIQTTFRKTPGLKLVSISVDPEKDTPKRLKYYSMKNHADSNFWVFLTADWDLIRRTMIEGFRIPVPDEPAFHTDKFVLVGKDLAIKGYYSANSLESLQELTAAITELTKPLPTPRKTPVSEGESLHERQASL